MYWLVSPARPLFKYFGHHVAAVGKRQLQVLEIPTRLSIAQREIHQRTLQVLRQEEKVHRLRDGLIVLQPNFSPRKGGKREQKFLSHHRTKRSFNNLHLRFYVQSHLIVFSASFPVSNSSMKKNEKLIFRLTIQIQKNRPFNQILVHEILPRF